MSGGGGKGGGSQTTGYRYYFGIHMGIGRGPVDELVAIKVGDKLAWTGSRLLANGQSTLANLVNVLLGNSPTVNPVAARVTDNIDTYIDQPNLFGGDGKEGGVQGTMQVMMGGPEQTAASGLVSMLGGPLPGFRRMATVFFNGMVAANNPYPKPWKFRVRRAMKGWDGDVIMPEIARIYYGDPVDVWPPVKGILSHLENAIPATDTAPQKIHSEFGPDLILGTANPLSAGYNTGDLVASDTKFGGTKVLTGYGARASNVYFPVSATQSWRAEGWFRGGRGLLFELTANDVVAATLSIAENFGAPAYFDLNMNIMGAAGGVHIYGITPVTVPTGWFHAACQYDGVTNTATMFIDGAVLWSVGKVFFFPPSTNIPLVTLAGGTIECDEFFLRDIRSSQLWSTNTATNPNTLPTAEFGYTEPLVYDGTIVAMNAAHIIYECLTNREWGRGLDPSALDLSSFQACAQTLFNENFGLCLKWSRKDSIEAFVQSVIDHIGATIFTSRVMALITLRLIRADYVQNQVPLFEVGAGLLAISDNAVSAPGLGINQVIVTYHDPLSDEDKVVKVDNLAAIQAASGNVNSVSKDYPGIPVPEVALRVAQRDLRASSVTLRRFSLTFDRRGRSIEPGSVIRIRDAKRGIPETVVRVGRIDDGSLSDGTISITGVQDVFALPTTSYTSSVANTWTPPSNTGCLDAHHAFELPYFLIAHNTSAADLAYIHETAGYIGTVVGEGQAMNVGYKIAVRDSAPTTEDYPVNGEAGYCGFVPDWIP